MIIIFLVFIFFVKNINICEYFDFLLFCKSWDCKNIKLFFQEIYSKKESTNSSNDKDKHDIINSENFILKDTVKGSISENQRLKIPINIDENDIKNQEKPPNREISDINISFPEIDINKKNIYPENIITGKVPHNSFNKYDINPKGPDCEIYKPNILLGQKILIVMTYSESCCNIEKIYENGNNKTIKDAASHYGIGIVTVDNYNDAINELTKEENGKCPYYACWLINSNFIKEKVMTFLELLIVFWENGGAVVIFSDNEPFTVEVNLFLSMIKAGFTMDGSYIGKKYIYGDNSGLLNKPGLFNRKTEIYRFNHIQRQTLSHNLYKIYEGITISSITKNNKHNMEVKLDDIKPFIAFARDTEGGITSFLKLANDKGKGDLIIDGGFTKLFINMQEDGTFRYIQNIIGFTARPEIHLSNKISPKDYRPNKVSLNDIENLKNRNDLNLKDIEKDKDEFNSTINKDISSVYSNFN